MRTATRAYLKHGVGSNAGLYQSVPFMSKRDFAQLEQDLDQAVSRSKETKDPKLRRDLLVELPLLLFEADRLLLEMPD
jgi:hypothetical protein